MNANQLIADICTVIRPATSLAANEVVVVDGDDQLQIAEITKRRAPGGRIVIALVLVPAS